jgi:hypothetical protein
MNPSLGYRQSLVNRLDQDRSLDYRPHPSRLGYFHHYWNRRNCLNHPTDFRRRPILSNHRVNGPDQGQTSKVRKLGEECSAERLRGAHYEVRWKESC